MTNIARQSPALPDQAALLRDFHHALQNGSIASLSDALKAGLDPNTQEDILAPHLSTPRRRHLIESVINKHAQEEVLLPMLEALLEAGADPNQAISSGDGATALMQAICKNRHKMVRTLLEAGANVHATGAMGMSVLHMACVGTISGNIDLFEMLVQHCADLRVQPDHLHRTPLMFLGNCPQLSLWMLQRVPEQINCQDVNGDTALMYAIRCGNLESTQMLLAHGADFKARNKAGQDAVAYANELKSLHEKQGYEDGATNMSHIIECLQSFAHATEARLLISRIHDQAHAVVCGSAP